MDSMKGLFKRAKVEAPLGNEPAKPAGMDTLWAMMRRIKAQVEVIENGLTAVRRDVYRLDHKQRDMTNKAPSVENAVPGNGGTPAPPSVYPLPDPFVR